jgi:hypothetical protein
MRRRSVLAGSILVALAALGGVPAGATHAPDHRFIVLGYVTDEARRPLAGAPIIVTRVKTGLEYRTRTEPDGFYLVVLHLHDEDEGERLSLAAGSTAYAQLTARYDVRDKRVERGTRVDVRGAQVVEDRRAFAETLRAWLAR